jgi:hypothetical protein
MVINGVHDARASIFFSVSSVYLLPLPKQSWFVFLGHLYFKPESFPFVFIFFINVMFISPSPLSIYLRRDWTSQLMKKSFSNERSGSKPH